MHRTDCYQILQGSLSVIIVTIEQKLLQESCAIAKMSAQCAIYMGALKNFGTP